MVAEILQIIVWIVAVILIISGIDDLIVDISYWIYRRKYKKQLPELSEIREAKETPIAIVIGAWQEHSVIGRTLSIALNKIQYKNYRIFVGVYQNDEKTQEEVMKFASADPRVIMCVNPKNGPTSKADNLNNVFNVIKYYERSHTEFSIILIHDSEDFIHPYSLKLYNYLISYKGNYAVQIPVVPIKSKLGKLFHRTYCDAFAEMHNKELIVRQSLGAYIPFAGTGMAFNRKIFHYLETNDKKYLDSIKEDIANNKINTTEISTKYWENFSRITGDLNHNVKIFNESNLTEDYEMGLKFHKIGLKTVFVNLIMKSDGTPDSEIATQSYFPNSFWGSIKQRSRWIAGINLQNWKIHKWKGSWLTKYFLMRDRKGIISSFILLFSYLGLIYSVLNILDTKYGWGIFPPVIDMNSTLWYVLMFCFSFLIVRLFHRLHFTYKWYGLKYSIFSVFRLLLDNIINFFASIRAIKLYLKMKDKSVIWDKTDHY
ncbi:MAG: glycosyltransferase [Ignavibacteria bacterium]|nr:glycosyltransferase [Ignavibacteria bacterium]